MLRAGLFLYDRLGGRSSVPPSRTIDLRSDPRGEPLLGNQSRALAYSDAWVDDSRLVVLNALDAAERGTTIWRSTELLDARRDTGTWIAKLGEPDGEREVQATVLVNTAGPWVAEVAGRITARPLAHGVRLVQGSHLILPRLYAGEHAYLLQNPDGRVVFAIPYETDFTLVGTTEVTVATPERQAAITDGEVDYLLDTVRQTFARPISKDEVVSSFAGVRPLQDDGAGRVSGVTRDYAIEYDADGAPLVSVIGGKLTTYRRLAEKVMAELAPHFPGMGAPWTSKAPLPGGDIVGRQRLLDELIARHPALPSALLERLARSYGSRSLLLLDGCSEPEDLGFHFGGGLFAREVDYLVRTEWAHSSEDILFRRTKLGLHVGSATADALESYLLERLKTGTPSRSIDRSRRQT
jgi:glycerol-3-phosphate dehydrogenase